MEGQVLSNIKGYHKPVLLREAIDALNIRDAWYLDATPGDGGHLIEIIKRGGKVVGIDVDPQALQRVQQRLALAGVDKSRYILIRGNFRDLKNLIQPAFAKASADKQTDISGQKFAGAKSNLAGAIFDLGVSSLQLGDPERGFSFANKGPLDMRMDPALGVRAFDLIKLGGRKELYELFKRLGEEKHSWAVADALVRAREIKGDRLQGTGISSTKELADLVVGVYRKAGVRKWQIHPATRVFQALRIAVNDELNALKEGLDQVISLIEKGGRIVVISFHSLEDRIVKHTFKGWADQGPGEVLTGKPIVPGDREIEENPRSRSAKMRVFGVL